MPRLRSFLSAIKPTRLGVLFAVLIGLGVGFWQWGQPPKPRVVLEIGLGPSARFSPDGQTLATIHGNDPFYLALWDAESGEKKVDLGKIELPGSVVFSPDSRTLACRFKEQIRVWDLASGRELATYDDKDGVNHQPLVFSPEGKLLAVRKNFLLWDVAANKIVKKLVQGGNEDILAGGNDWIMVLGKDNVIKVWDLVTATILAESRDIPKPEKGDILTSVELSSDGHSLLYHPYDVMQLKAVFTYDLLTGHRQDLLGNWKALPTVFPTISPDGHTIALAVANPLTPQQKSWWNRFTEWLGVQSDLPDLYVVLQAFPSGEELNVLRNCSGTMFSPDGRTLAVHGTDSKTVQLFDLPIRKPIGKILAQAGLAALVTLLALNGLSWLRRRRKEHAHLIPSGSAAQLPMAETK